VAMMSRFLGRGDKSKGSKEGGDNMTQKHRNLGRKHKRIEIEREQERDKLEQDSMKGEREEEERKEKERRKGDIMNRTEMTSGKIDFTQGTMGLVDRMEAHRAGTYMKNVVISNAPPPDRELNLARLRTFKPQNDMVKMTLSDIEPFDLTKEYHEFPFTNALTEDQLKSLNKYTLISDIFIHYMPLDTFFSESSPVNFFVNDFRKVQDTTVRYFPLTHSGGYNILMSLDFCVRTQDLNLLTLSISTNLSTFRKGVAWSSVKVILTLIHMEFPIKTNMQETMGVLHLADSDLQDFVSDPRGSDGVITPEALHLMKNAYKRGDVENVLTAKDDRKEINPDRTVFMPQNQDVNARDLLQSLREQHLSKERKDNLKPAMKKPKGSPPREAFVEDDVMPGESLSQTSEDQTIDIPRTSSPYPRKMKSINFG